MTTKNNLVTLARGLRKRLTEAEKLLWYHLRTKQFQGLRFRKQAPVGPFIVDFVCYPKRIVIEIDGSQHAEDNNKASDQQRDRWLKSQGFTVLRFWNNEVLQNINGVLEEILKHCA